MLSAELAAANWPLVEKVWLLTTRPSMVLLEHVHVTVQGCALQAAKRFGLKLASPVPATCGHFDCALSDPFTWSATSQPSRRWAPVLPGPTPPCKHCRPDACGEALAFSLAACALQVGRLFWKLHRQPEPHMPCGHHGELLLFGHPHAAGTPRTAHEPAQADAAVTHWQAAHFYTPCDVGALQKCVAPFRALWLCTMWWGPHSMRPAC